MPPPDPLPPELLVHDDLLPCPYLPPRLARLPLRLPLRPLSPPEFDQRLQQGDRRHGALLYRPTCPNCSACQAIRLDVEAFLPSKTHRRILRRGDQLLRYQIAPPTVSRTRARLYDIHLAGRSLRSAGDEPMTLPRYRQFLADSCCTTLEFSYWADDQLVAIAISDLGAVSLSAHYTFYDPAFSSWSIGTYSILKQLEVCRLRHLRFLYLGLFVADNPHMSYKARFLPHERLVDGSWLRFDRSC